MLLFTIGYDPENWVSCGAYLSQTVQQQLDAQRVLIAHLIYQSNMHTPMIERVGLYALYDNQWELAYEISPLIFMVAPAALRAVSQ